MARKELSIEDLYSGIMAGDRAILARALTLIEGRRHDQHLKGQELLKMVLPQTGHAFRLGISGVPGAGKSTFIESFGMFLINKGLKVAVLAVDPSSERSGGSLLGDKTRMRELSTHEKAFVRPSPSGGRLGGVAHKTQEAMLLCEAAGYDVIIVETVGVGQSETTTASMVDFFMMLMIAGAGDELQGIKRGILEVIDMMVINKADGDQWERASRAKSEYEMALHILNSAYEGFYNPRVLCASALMKTGLAEIWEQMIYFQEKGVEQGYIEKKRREQMLKWMWRVVEDELMRNLKESAPMKKVIKPLEKDLLAGSILPFEGAKNLLNTFYKEDWSID